MRPAQGRFRKIGVQLWRSYFSCTSRVSPAYMNCALRYPKKWRAGLHKREKSIKIPAECERALPSYIESHKYVPEQCSLFGSFRALSGLDALVFTTSRAFPPSQVGFRRSQLRNPVYTNLNTDTSGYISTKIRRLAELRQAVYHCEYSLGMKCCSSIPSFRSRMLKS